MIIMLLRLIAEYKWALFALVFSVILVHILNSNIFWNATEMKVSQIVLDFNLVFETFIVFVFSNFVVFGIKGFLERYAQKSANVVIFITGVILSAIIFVLSYQILFQN